MPDEILLKDLQITRRAFDQQVSDRDSVDLVASASGDLETVSGRANLAQAIINRLFTRKGELAKLGHPNYGSRLYTLIGEFNNTRIRGLAEIYIREALAQEPRIQEITRMTFARPSRGIDRNVLEATITVKPIGEQSELTFTIPINLEG